jgi:hypothetical protein
MDPVSQSPAKAQEIAYLSEWVSRCIDKTAVRGHTSKEMGIPLRHVVISGLVILGPTIQWHPMKHVRRFRKLVRKDHLLEKNKTHYSQYEENYIAIKFQLRLLSTCSTAEIQAFRSPLFSVR